jgi:hypothetical protein
VVSDVYLQDALSAAAADRIGRFLRPAGHFDDPAIGRVPDRIVDEVAQRLPETVRIGDSDNRAAGAHFNPDAAVCLAGEP